MPESDSDARHLSCVSDPYAVDLGALMPFAPHLRITALGTLGSSDERFSYGINVDQAGPAESLPLDGLEDLRDDVAAFHRRPETRIASVAVLRSVKFAYIGPDGKYIGDAVELVVANGAGGVVDSTGLVLPQTALAVSLLTNDRGPRKRGRFYIPMPVIDVQPTNGFTCAASYATGVATSVQTLLNDIRNAPGSDTINNSLDVRPVVASTFGYNTEITGVRVGRVMDTIRSRRNRLPELYSATLPVGG